MTPAKATPAVEHKKVSEIKDLNPFKYKVTLILIFLLIHFIIHDTPKTRYALAKNLK